MKIKAREKLIKWKNNDLEITHERDQACVINSKKAYLEVQIRHDAPFERVAINWMRTCLLKPVKFEMRHHEH